MQCQREVLKYDSLKFLDGVKKCDKTYQNFFNSGHALLHQDRDYTYILNTFEFKVQESKNYRFYWLTTKNALQEQCEH